MDKFSFYNPTRIESGRDKEQPVGQILAEYGVRIQQRTCEVTR